LANTSEVAVLIVGGGSAGSILSLELARRGIEFRCIDRMPTPRKESRAIALHARTLELFDRVDRRLSRRCLDRGLWHNGYVMHFLHEGERTEVRPGLDFTRVASRYNCFLSHNQSETESLIRGHMSSEYGQEIEYNTRFVDLNQDNDGVTATVVHTDQDDEEETIRCRYLVAADGINSRVREQQGIAIRERGYQGRAFQNLDINLNGFPDCEDHFHFLIGPDHFMMVSKVPGGYFRLLMNDRGEAEDPDVSPQQACKRVLDQHYDGVTFGDVVWYSKWETWERLAETFRKGNVFLAGDAAHVHSVAGGQGMNCCMQDAFNLGWKLALVVSGQAKPDLLDTYEKERRPVAEQVLWAASSLHDIFMSHGKSVAQRERVMFEPGYTEKVVGYCSGIAHTYKDRVGDPHDSSEVAGPAAGDRAPDVDFETGGTLWDLCRHPRFTLLAIPGDGDPYPIVKPLQERFGSVMDVAVPPPSDALTQRYGPGGGRFFLVRPDGYVGFKCATDDVHLLEAYLGAILTL
jgi:2-polyprenyl-6-methoxyphenol hydroxylase-like FAD-dependent oxidoreductase